MEDAESWLDRAKGIDRTVASLPERRLGHVFTHTCGMKIKNNNHTLIHQVRNTHTAININLKLYLEDVFDELGSELALLVPVVNPSIADL